MKKWLIVAGLALALAPSTASADWLFTPNIGAGFGGSAEGREHLTWGASLGWMGAGVLGWEADDQPHRPVRVVALRLRGRRAGKHPQRERDKQRASPQSVHSFPPTLPGALLSGRPVCTGVASSSMPRGRSPKCRSSACKGETGVEHAAQRFLDGLRERRVPARRDALVGQITAVGKLHLHRMHAAWDT